MSLDGGDRIRSCPCASVLSRCRITVVALALAVAACGGEPAVSGQDPTEPEPPVSGVVPAQSLRINVDWVDGTQVASGEARHWLHARPLDEVLGDREFRQDSRGADHALELLDRDGTVLESHPVYVHHVAVDPGPDFEQWEAVFQDPPDFASFRFVHGSQTVHEQYLSPNAPEVSFSRLEQGQVFASDAQFWFELLIDDKDHDDLDLLILVSVDGGRYMYDRAGFSASSSLNSSFQGLSTMRHITAEDYGSPFAVSSGVRTRKIPRIVAEGSQAVRLLAVVSDGGRVTAAQSPVFVLEPF